MKRMIIFGLLSLLLAPAAMAQEKIEAPVWNVGDKWTFKRADGVRYTNEVVDIKEDLYLVKMGKDPDLYGYDKKTMNAKFLIKDAGGRTLLTGSWRKILDFPMSVGKAWKDTSYAKPRGSNVEVTFINEYNLEGDEEVTTPAGKFKTYRIRFKQTNISSKNGGLVYYWYSPDVKTWIKRQSDKSQYWYGITLVEDTELISYSLK